VFFGDFFGDVIIIIIIFILESNSTKPQAEILNQSPRKICNNVSFAGHCVLERDRIPSLKGYRMALERKHGFSDVTCDSGYPPASFLCQFYSQMPAGAL